MADKRRPRKKGQHRNSPSHDDLFTDENPKGTIKGLGFKDPEIARKGIAIIKKSKATHAHKVQATLVMVQRGKVVIKNTKDPEKKKNLKAANKIWSDFLETLKEKTKKMKESKEITLLREYIIELLAEDVRKVGPNRWCPFIDDKVTRADQEADRKAGRPVRKHRSYKRTKTGKIRMKRVDGGCGTKDKANRTMAAAMQ